MHGIAWHGVVAFSLDYYVTQTSRTDYLGD